MLMGLHQAEGHLIHAARGQQDRQGGAQRPDLGQHSGAAEARHVQVQDHDIAGQSSFEPQQLSLIHI